MVNELNRELPLAVDRYIETMEFLPGYTQYATRIEFLPKEAAIPDFEITPTVVVLERQLQALGWGDYYEFDFSNIEYTKPNLNLLAMNGLKVHPNRTGGHHA